MIKNIKIAIDSILANKFRALLTTLGIIFGVAAVIAMLAVGNGAQQKVLEQLKIVGVNNIIVQSVFEEKKEIDKKEQKKSSKKFSPGLSIKDLNNILKVVPNIQNYAVEVGEESYAVSENKRLKTKIIGVNKSYFNLFNLSTERGLFFNIFHNKENKNVCVLGNKISRELFPKTDPIGKTIRVGNLNLKVIGIIKNLSGVGTELQEMGINDYNKEIYIPINTYLTKFKNRGLISIKEDWEEEKNLNKNQLDKVVIQVKNSDELTDIGKIIFNIINRRHNKIPDFKLIIPEQILKQKKETDDLFNWLLGAIASISLLVGGIGIMNIMLASVMERIREIGLRMAIGATKKDIKLQFVFEALFISLLGGFLGVLLGIGISYFIEFFLKMPIKISLFSILISFFISVLTGILFGYLPAKKASEQNPVNSLKYE